VRHFPHQRPSAVKIQVSPFVEKLFLKQRLSKLLGVEGLQVVRLFAEADELDGQAELLLDGDDHAAFAGAVELGHDEAGERDGLVEFARLVQRIHAGAAIEYQQHFVRRAGQLLADDAVELVQLLHEVVLGVQAAGGVDEQVIRMAGLRGGDGIVRHGGGIRAIGAGDDLDLEAGAPELELLDGGGAEGVTRGEQHGFFSATEDNVQAWRWWWSCRCRSRRRWRRRSGRWVP